MPAFSIRPMKEGELKVFYKYIKEDFAAGEYSPYAVLLQQLEEGSQKGFVLHKDNHDRAYTICTASKIKDYSYVLISLFAVLEGYRGQGIGTVFLKALKKKYEHKGALIVEVEQPELADTSEDRELRKRRIRFYERLGFYLIPDVDYSIWNIPMHLMALPLQASREIINRDIGPIMYGLYRKLLGEQYIEKLQIRVLESM